MAIHTGCEMATPSPQQIIIYSLWKAKRGWAVLPTLEGGWVISALAPPIAHHWEAVRQRGLAGRQIGEQLEGQGRPPAG